MTPRHPQLAEALRSKSLKWGNFTLSSGKASKYYIDGKLTSMDPLGAKLIAEAVFKEIEGMDVDAVGGMDMGATPIVGALAYHGQAVGRPLPVFVARKEVKKHGTMKEIEGPVPAPPCKVVIVDDVVTSGKSIIQAIEAARRHGAEVVLALAILDRNAGAHAALRALGVRYQPLVTSPDIGISDEPTQPSGKLGMG